MIIKGKQVLVVGLARTGVALTTYLQSRGARVTVTDSKNKTDLEPVLKQLAQVKRVKYELGRHVLKTFISSDLIIVSPGVPSDMEYLEKAKAKKIPVISELEFAAQHIKLPMIAVTGTNGKTTTTMVIGQ